MKPHCKTLMMWLQWLSTNWPNQAFVIGLAQQHGSKWENWTAPMTGETIYHLWEWNSRADCWKTNLGITFSWACNVEVWYPTKSYLSSGVWCYCLMALFDVIVRLLIKMAAYDSCRILAHRPHTHLACCSMLLFDLIVWCSIIKMAYGCLYYDSCLILAHRPHAHLACHALPDVPATLARQNQSWLFAGTEFRWGRHSLLEEVHFRWRTFPTTIAGNDGISRFWIYIGAPRQDFWLLFRQHVWVILRSVVTASSPSDPTCVWVNLVALDGWTDGELGYVTNTHIFKYVYIYIYM